MTLEKETTHLYGGAADEGGVQGDVLSATKVMGFSPTRRASVSVAAWAYVGTVFSS